MKLRAPDIEVTEQSPYGADCLGLEEFGKALQEVVTSSDASLVISLDAAWGQGKTTFLRMWRQQLKNRGITCLYFNAWETDFAGDPLLALLAELGDEIRATNSIVPNAAKKHFEKAKQIGLQIAKNAVPALAKLATAGLLDLSEINEEILSDLAEKVAEAQLKAFQDSKESISSFRRELEVAAGKLSTKDGETFPLVIVVDELDRCRPDYAVKVLETIKHFFSVPNVAFLVATDLRQLAASVRHTYGAEVDADGYLRRFFDLPLALPPPSFASFIDVQFSRFALSGFFDGRTQHELRYERENLREAFVALLSPKSASLRDVERCFALISLAVRATSEKQYLHPLLLSVLVVLRVKNPQLYANYVSNEASVEDVVAFFCSTREGRTFFTSEHGLGAIVEASLLVARISRYRGEDPTGPYKKRAEDETLPETQRLYACRVIEAFQQGWLRNVVGSLPSAIKKIELVARSEVAA